MPETWEVKAFSAEDVSKMIKEARQRFIEDNREQDASYQQGECDTCHKENVLLAQHWNDVGGSYHCEMCWVDSITWFWMNEAVAEQQNDCNRCGHSTQSYEHYAECAGE